MTAAQPGGGEGVRAIELSGELGTSSRESRESSKDCGMLDKGDEDRDLSVEFMMVCDQAVPFIPRRNDSD